MNENFFFFILTNFQNQKTSFNLNYVLQKELYKDIKLQYSKYFND
jgi:hypothetical protein